MNKRAIHYKRNITKGQGGQLAPPSYTLRLTPLSEAVNMTLALARYLYSEPIEMESWLIADPCAACRIALKDAGITSIYFTEPGGISWMSLEA